MRCVIIAIFMSVLVTSTVQQHGRQVANCVWEYEDGHIIDLNGVGKVDGTAKWNNEASIDVNQDPNLYAINPCHGFTLGIECQNVTVCRISQNGNHLNIADASSGRMYYSEDDRAVLLEYNHTDSADPDLLFISRFSFSCSGDAEAQVVVQGIVASTPIHVIHRFILLVPCVPTIERVRAPGQTTSPPTITPQPVRTLSSATPPASVSLHPIKTLSSTTPPASVSLHPIKTGTPPVTKASIKPPPPSPPDNNLTFGGILCITFVCFVCGYFFIGSFYLFCYSGARGVEIIPHIRFWLDLPNLILDGFFFLFSCCGKPQMVSSSGRDYEKI